MEDKNLNRVNETEKESVPQTEKKENKVISFFKTVWRWTKRMFMGGANAFYKEKENEGESGEEEKIDAKIFEIEKIVSPGKQRLNNFLSKKLAVGATVVLALIFAVMMIGPIFNPYVADYEEGSQKNIAPGMNMMSVPGWMDEEIENISSVSKFSVGLSKSGKVAVWGDTKGLSWDLDDVPEGVTKEKILFAAAGSDHAIAIGQSGTVYGWGNSALAQYGSYPQDKPHMQFVYNYMPSVVLNGQLDVSKIKQLVCGMQVSAIVMNDGKVYMWGNNSIGATNMSSMKGLSNVEKVAFTNDAVVALLKDGTFSSKGTEKFKYTYIDNNGTKERVVLNDYLEQNNLKVVDIACASGSVGLVLDNGAILFTGTIYSTENAVPALPVGEKYVSISGGMKHYTAITSTGRVVSWGDNGWKQTSVPKAAAGAAQIFTGPFQNYAVNEDGEIIAKWGLKGYLMGTDSLGRDIWNRILNGGRLTMTIGAISVIISSIIGIIVGCLSGYFGGWVDMFFMRLAEIVSAIPFMPFALILSMVAQSLGLSEGTRIVLIMVILGLLSWTGLARLVRGQVLAEREKEFVLAAKAMGVPERKIAFKHILPNIISIIIVTMTLDFASCMLTESSLSYLGFGVQLPRPTWGNMLNGASNSIVIQNYWWQWVFPSIFLMITTICINIIGDALRDVMDPKSNSER